MPYVPVMPGCHSLYVANRFCNCIISSVVAYWTWLACGTSEAAAGYRRAKLVPISWPNKTQLGWSVAEAKAQVWGKFGGAVEKGFWTASK